MCAVGGEWGSVLARLKNHRACLNPPPKSTGTNRIEDYLPDELVLIGCQHRTDSMQPEKCSFLGRGRTCVLTPFSPSGGPNGPTERAQIKYCLMEIYITVNGGGHISRTTRCCCARGMRKRLSSVLIWLARPKILDGPKHDFLPRNGTNGHEQPRSVPSGSTRSSRVNTRPQMNTWCYVYEIWVHVHAVLCLGMILA